MSLFDKMISGDKLEVNPQFGYFLIGDINDSIKELKSWKLLICGNEINKTNCDKCNKRILMYFRKDHKILCRDCVIKEVFDL